MIYLSLSFVSFYGSEYCRWEVMCVLSLEESVEWKEVQKSNDYDILSRIYARSIRRLASLMFPFTPW